MHRQLSTIIYDRLTAQITNSAEPNLAGVLVWNEARPAEEGQPYVVFSLDTSVRGNGSAPLHDASVDVTSYAPSGAVAAELAEAVRGALEDYVAVSEGVKLAGLNAAGSRREYDAESRLWYIAGRWTGLAIG